MRIASVLCTVAVAFAVSTVSFGHGIPITVTVDENNKLVASNLQPLYSPIDLTSGYAPMVLVDDEDGAVMSQVTFSNSNPLGLQGSYQITTLPGFNVNGMDQGSGLYLQVIPRPVMGTNPVSQRMLWHWSLSASQTPGANPVRVDPNNESLVVASDPDGAVLSMSLPQTGNASPALKVAQPLGSELGTHQHYLNYFLGNSPAADIGVYGFFARVTSPNYGSSDPFLVIFNNGLFADENPGQLLAGALAINNAALLAGDYNHDDRVDAADYVLWRKTVGSTSTFAADGTGDKVVDLADYDVWRRNFGLVVPASGLGVGSVPEPTSALLLVVGFAGFSRFSRRPRLRARVLA
jgi:hypothetical protein